MNPNIRCIVNHNCLHCRTHTVDLTAWQNKITITPDDAWVKTNQYFVGGEGRKVLWVGSASTHQCCQYGSANIPVSQIDQCVPVSVKLL